LITYPSFTSLLPSQFFLLYLTFYVHRYFILRAGSQYLPYTTGYLLKGTSLSWTLLLVRLSSTHYTRSPILDSFTRSPILDSYLRPLSSTRSPILDSYLRPLSSTRSPILDSYLRPLSSTRSPILDPYLLPYSPILGNLLIQFYSFQGHPFLSKFIDTISFISGHPASWTPSLDPHLGPLLLTLLSAHIDYL